MPGVVKVITAKDIPGQNNFSMAPILPEEVSAPLCSRTSWSFFLLYSAGSSHEHFYNEYHKTRRKWPLKKETKNWF